MLEQRKKQVLDKFNQLVQKANALYKLTLPNIGVRFDLKGRSAGQACMRGGHYYVRFNTDMMQGNGWEHVFNNTVPHELAHIICFYRPSLGHNHDHGWRRVCMALGGSGARCHKEEVTYAKGDTYNYRTTHGHEVTVSQTIHTRIQQGRTYTYKGGKGSLNRTCAYKLQDAANWTTPANAFVHTPPVQPRPFVPPQAITFARGEGVPTTVDIPPALVLRPTPPVAIPLRTPIGAQSKAERLRTRIRDIKAANQGKDEAIAWAMQQFSWPRAQAKSSVEFNWNRV